MQYAWHFIGMNDELTLKQEAATAQNALYEQVAELIRKSRDYVRTAVNTAMVYTYYGIGQHIVENEQQGQNRAQYGKAVLKELSKRLTKELVRGGRWIRWKMQGNCFLCTQNPSQWFGNPSKSCHQERIPHQRFGNLPLSRKAPKIRLLYCRGAII